MVRNKALLLVATRGECRAVMAAVHAATGAAPRPDSRQGVHTVWRLGFVGGVEILLAQSVQQGMPGPGGMMQVSARLVDCWRPDLMILTGICFGLREDWQRLGDVVVADRVHELDLRKAHEGGVTPRGENVSPSVLLLDRCHTATVTWPEIPAVHFGPMLSSGTLVNSRALRAELRLLHPDAIAGEMEGASVYATGAHEKVDWIVVKGISDWAVDKSDVAQDLAARNAADFVVHMIGTGDLPGRPARTGEG